MRIAAININPWDHHLYWPMGAVPAIDSISAAIYKAARAGTEVNPGLPETLSLLVVAQAKHETATWDSALKKMIPFTSNAFVTDNNLFGYKWVGSRYQSGPGIESSEGDHYGNYDDYRFSVMELVDWIYRRVKEGKFPADLQEIKTAEQYADLLKGAGYYGAPVKEYAGGLKRWFSNTAVKTGAGMLGLIALGVLGYQLLKNRKSLN